MTNSGDQVALAVDGLRNAPLTDHFYRTAIASGSITPPIGESASVRRTNFAVGLCALCFGFCGLTGMLVAFFWRA